MHWYIYLNNLEILTEVQEKQNLIDTTLKDKDQTYVDSSTELQLKLNI